LLPVKFSVLKGRQEGKRQFYEKHHHLTSKQFFCIGSTFGGLSARNANRERLNGQKNDSKSKGVKMIEIINIKAIRKGMLLGTCDVYIAPWDMEIMDVKIFEKGSNRWIGMPSKEIPNGDFEKKYVELIKFRKSATSNRFKEQILNAVKKELTANPNMEPIDAIKELGDFPF